MSNFWSSDLGTLPYSSCGLRKRISEISDLKLVLTTTGLILFVALVAVYTVISISFYNLTQIIKNKDLWISLFLSSVRYLC